MHISPNEYICFQIILKTLDDKESMLSQVRSQLQEEPDIEEYQVLLTEIEGVLANLAALRSFVLSQCDQNQVKLSPTKLKAMPKNPCPIIL